MGFIIVLAAAAARKALRFIIGLAASARRRPPPPMVTTAWRQRIQGLACCEELAAESQLHPYQVVVTTEIPVLYAAGAHGCPRNWSLLPDLPLSVVAGRLDTLKDFLSFRGVCTSWRSVGTAVAEDVVMASHPPIFFGASLTLLETPRRFYHRRGDQRRVYRGRTPPLLGRGYSIAGVSHGYVNEWCTDEVLSVAAVGGEGYALIKDRAVIVGPIWKSSTVIDVCGRLRRQVGRGKRPHHDLHLQQVRPLRDILLPLQLVAF